MLYIIPWSCAILCCFVFVFYANLETDKWPAIGNTRIFKDNQIKTNITLKFEITHICIYCSATLINRQSQQLNKKCLAQSLVISL